MKVYYLASPYSHKDPKVLCARYEEQGRIAAHLISKGYLVIAPIEMCHHLSQKYKLPGGYEYWQERDREFISRSDAVIVCKMDGWKESVGVTDEIEYAKSLGKQVQYLDPNTMEIV